MEKEHEEKKWQCEEGCLTLDLTSHIWWFESKDARKISVISWQDVGVKHPITAVVLLYKTDEGVSKEVIIEIWEKKFNEEFFTPSKDETWKKVLNLCKIILEVDTSSTEWWMYSSLKKVAEKIVDEFDNEIHVYYGTGLFFGMKKDVFGKTNEIECIPRRSLEFPSTRWDSLD